MKYCITIIALNLSWFSVFSQEFYMYSTNSNLVFLGNSNIINYYYNKGDYDSLFITTNNGYLHYNKMHSYCWHPDCKSDHSAITLYRIYNRDTFLIGDAEFKVCQYPLPILTLCNKYSGYISKSKLLNCPIKLKLPYEYIPFNCEPAYHIISYSILIIRNNKILNLNKINDNVLKDNVNIRFKNKDKVIFYNIIANIYYLRDSVRLSPIELTVKD